MKNFVAEQRQLWKEKAKTVREEEAKTVREEEAPAATSSSDSSNSSTSFRLGKPTREKLDGLTHDM